MGYKKHRLIDSREKSAPSRRGSDSVVLLASSRPAVVPKKQPSGDVYVIKRVYRLLHVVLLLSSILIKIYQITKNDYGD